MSKLERYDPSISGRIRYEHFHRYAFASRFVRDAVVLDIASGEGYGAAVLSRSAKSVVGVDIDPQAIQCAERKYGNSDSLNYVVGSADAIPFPDDTFDVVISLETIEHLPNPVCLMTEAVRVLKPTGVIIVSTPNKTIYNRYRKQSNEFHFSEMELEEFSYLISNYFENVDFYGQRMVVASSLAPVETSRQHRSNTVDYCGFTARNRGSSTNMVEPGIARMRNPEYFICVASNGPLPVTDGQDSIFLMASEDLWEEHSKILAWASGLHDEDEQLRAQMHDMQERLGRHGQDMALVQARAENLKELLTAREGELNRIHSGDHSVGIALLAPILTDITDEPIGEDLRSVLHGMSRAATRAAVYKYQIAQLTSNVQVAEERARQSDTVQINLMDEITRLRQDISHRDEALSELRHAAEERARLNNEVATLRDHVDARDSALRIAEETLNAQQGAVQFANGSAAAYKAYSTLARLHQELLDQRAWGRANAVLSPAREQSAIKLSTTNGAFAAFKKTGQFLPEYYARIANVPADLTTAWNHFRKHGCSDGLDCNPLLCTEWMHARHAGLSGYSASFVAVAAPGRYEDIIHPLFDPAYYRATNGLLIGPRDSALQHYMREGRRAGLVTHPMIDIGLWQQNASDDQVFDLVRYLTDPSWFRIPVHPFFNASFYLDTNGDVAAAGINPLLHYCLFGWQEGRNPNPMFDSLWYLASNPDVAEAGFAPLDHYVRHGSAEGRQPHPLFSQSYYTSRYLDVAEAGMPPYAHYLVFGKAEGRIPSSQIAELAGALPYWPRDGLVDVIREGQINISSLLAGTAWEKPPADFNASLSAMHRQYYMPQKLRDYIVDRFGEDVIDLYVELFEIVDRFVDGSNRFDTEYDVGVFAARISRLAKLRQSRRPEVSIVVPVYNNLVYTLTCIFSILENPSRFTFEIIIADDLSSDRTAEIVSGIGGVVRHIRHESNLGFLRNCNAAAEIASGDYLVFLNNDTIVLPGWLDNLIIPLENDRHIGLIGSKLLNGDGSLQEAGGILWSDGSAWNYGRNQEPWLPEFNYVKDVDYVSGASIALPRSVWRDLGGFDVYYEPAYCEDSDIAFRARDIGYRTLYQPRSMVVHHEGRSHGRDLSSGIKALQVTNQAKFFDRWKDVLQKDHFSNGENVFFARDRSRSRPHILIIDHYVPQWDQDAGSRTMYDYVKIFIKCNFHVIFWPDNLHEDRDYVVGLQQIGVEVLYSASYAGQFGRWLGENGEYLKYVLFSRPHITANYTKYFIGVGHIKKIYYGHDLHFRRIMNEYEIKKDPALREEASNWEALEIGICSQMDLVLYPSMEEVNIVRSRVPSNVSVVMLPMNVLPDTVLNSAKAEASRRATNGYRQIMFVGGFSHHPNADGIIWFVRNVMPLLRVAEPDLHLAIAGSNATEKIRALAAPDIEILGRVSDEALAALYKRSALSIAPLRYGGGVKGKVIESMAAGVPVVMTAIGAQGMPGADTFSFVADEPHDFAQAILEVVRNPREAAHRASCAVDFLRDTYSEDAVRRRMLSEIPEFALSQS